MLEAQCYINKNIMGEHARFLSCLPRDKSDEVYPEIRDLPEFTHKVLGWEAEDLKQVPQRVALTGDMASLEVVLPQYHETLRPTHAVPVFRPKEDENPWMMLIQELATRDRSGRCGRSGQQPALERGAARQVRAATAGDTGSHRFAVERSAVAVGVFTARRKQRARDVQRR